MKYFFLTAIAGGMLFNSFCNGKAKKHDLFYKADIKGHAKRICVGTPKASYKFFAIV